MFLQQKGFSGFLELDLADGTQVELKKGNIGEVEEMKKCNENIEKALELAEELLDLGQRGDEEREDDGCGVLFGVIRDFGYKLRELADKEKGKHVATSRWV